MMNRNLSNIRRQSGAPSKGRKLNWSLDAMGDTAELANGRWRLQMILSEVKRRVALMMI